MSARTATPAPTGTPATPTPTGRAARTRHVGAWVLVVAVALVLAVLTAVVQSTTPPGRDPLDPRSATASGSMALVRVLEQRGTRVDVVRDADRVGDGTVFVDDVSGVLDPDVARRLVRRAEHVVLVSGDPRVLDAVGLPLEPAARPGDGDTVSTARCGIPAAATAGEVSTDGTAYARTPGAWAPTARTPARPGRSSSAPRPAPARTALGASPGRTPRPATSPWSARPPRSATTP